MSSPPVRTGWGEQIIQTTEEIPTMRKVMLFLAALLALAVSSQATAGTRWQHYGADPAYATKAAAIADAPNVMRRAGMPAAAVTAMTAAMRARPERIELRRGDHLDFMRSGRTGLWRDVAVDFIPPPGRGVSVVVAADRWVAVVEGVSYELIIPDVCNNTSLRFRTQAIAVNDCVVDNIENRTGNEVAIAWARYEFADDECAAFRKVDSPFQLSNAGPAWQPLAPCPQECSFDGVVVGRAPRAMGTIPLTGVGHWQIRHRRNELMAYCLKLGTPDTQEGRPVYGSFASVVRWQQDYQLIGGREYHARVFYSTQDMTQAGIPLTTGPRALAFWAANERDLARIRTQIASR